MSSNRRLLACVEAWPDAEDGMYDPHCCRFPKSCSPYPYPEQVAAGIVELEPAVLPRPSAPDATAGDGLREADRLYALVREWDDGERTYFAVAEDMADVLRDWLPALRDVLAAAARDAEKVRRVRELAEDFTRNIWTKPATGSIDQAYRNGYDAGRRETAERLRQALDAP